MFIAQSKLREVFPVHQLSPNVRPLTQQDAMRSWVPRGVRINLPFGFSRAVGSASDTSNDKVPYDHVNLKNATWPKHHPATIVSTKHGFSPNLKIIGIRLVVKEDHENTKQLANNEDSFCNQQRHHPNHRRLRGWAAHAEHYHHTQMIFQVVGRESRADLLNALANSVTSPSGRKPAPGVTR